MSDTSVTSTSSSTSSDLSSLLASLTSSSSTSTQSSTAGAVHFTGLGNGTDFDSVIDKMVALEKIPLTRLEATKKTWTDKTTQIQNLNSKLLALKTTLQGFDTPGEFMIKTVDSSDPTYLSATAGSTAINGSHSISIASLAQNQILTSTSSNASSSTDITGGMAQQFDFTYPATGSPPTTYSVFVPAGSSLDTLAAAINNNGPSSGKVRASVLKVSDTDYRLQLTGMDLGANNTVAVAASTTVPGFGSASFQTTQAAQDAQVRVDGYPPTGWISRQSNSISDVITGVTLNLREVTGSNASIKIATSMDKDKVKQNVSTFVTQINDVLSQIKTLTQVTTSSSGQTTAALFTGDFSMRSIESALKSVLSDPAIATDANKDVYTVLSQIGIETDAIQGSPTYGQLVIDDATLDSALTTNPDSVAELFSAHYDGATDSSSFSFQSVLTGTTKAGSYDVAYTVSGGAVTSATINGNPATWDPVSKQLTGSLSGSAEYGLSLTVNNLADGNYSGTARVKLGKTGEFINALSTLTEPTNGTIQISENNYADQISSIDDRLDYENRRITDYQTDLKNRFSQLDTLLNYYSNLESQMTSSIKSLSSASS